MHKKTILAISAVLVSFVSGLVSCDNLSHEDINATQIEISVQQTIIARDTKNLTEVALNSQDHTEDQQEIIETPTPTNSKGGLIDQGGGSVSNQTGASIIFPEESLSASQEVSIKEISSEDVIKPDDREILGPVFEFQIEQEIFNNLVTIYLPYDESLIPEGRLEGEVYAAFLHDGAWRPIHGNVDTEKNLVTVETYHASIWTVFIELLSPDGIDKATTVYRCIESLFDPEEIPQTEEEAEALIAQRSLEWEAAFLEANFTIEAFDEALWAGLEDEVKNELALFASEFLVEAIGANAAVLTIGGAPVAFWGGVTLSTLYLFDVSQYSGETLSALLKLEYAHQNLMTAYGFLYILQNKDPWMMPNEIIEGFRGVCGVRGFEDDDSSNAQESGNEDAQGKPTSESLVFPKDFFYKRSFLGKSNFDSANCTGEHVTKVENVKDGRFAQTSGKYSWNCDDGSTPKLAWTEIVDLLTGKEVGEKCEECYEKYLGPFPGPASETIEIMGRSIDVFVKQDKVEIPTNPGWVWFSNCYNYFDLKTGLSVKRACFGKFYYNGVATNDWANRTWEIIETNIPLGFTD